MKLFALILALSASLAMADDAKKNALVLTSGSSDWTTIGTVQKIPAGDAVRIVISGAILTLKESPDGTYYESLKSPSKPIVTKQGDHWIITFDKPSKNESKP